MTTEDPEEAAFWRNRIKEYLFAEGANDQEFLIVSDEVCQQGKSEGYNVWFSALALLFYGRQDVMTDILDR